MKKLGLIAALLVLTALSMEATGQYGSLILLTRATALTFDTVFLVCALVVGLVAAFSRREWIGILAALVLGTAFTAYVWAVVPRERVASEFVEITFVRMWLTTLFILLASLGARLLPRPRTALKSQDR